MRPIRTLLLLLPFTVAPLLAQDKRPAPAPAPAPARPVAPAARPAAATGLSLQQVRDSFAKSDADRSGKLDAAEALAAGLDASAFSAAYADADQGLDQDEFVVGSEGRAAKQPGGVAADLSAESTRLQALRRAQKSEDLRTRREAAPNSAPGAARTGAAREPSSPRAAAAEPAGREAGATAAAPAVNGPAAARRAAAVESPADREKRLLEIRESIARRLRNGELSAEQAQEAYAALDRRIANALGEGKPNAASEAAPAADASKKEVDLKAIEENLNRRLRNSELDPAKAQEVFGDVSRRIDNAQGAGAPAPASGDTAGAAAAPQPPASLRDRVIEAQGDLTRRMRNAELSPEQAAAEKEAIRKRTENAVEKAKTGDGASAPAAQPAAGTPAPARARGAPAQVPPVAAPPARRGADAGTPPPSNPPPARGAGRPATAPGTPAAQPAPVRPAPQDKPATAPAPARPAPKPATPPANGGDAPARGR